MRVPSTAPPDVQQSFREIWTTLDRFAGSQNIDLGGRRIINAGQAIDATDYMLKTDVDQLFGSVPKPSKPTPPVASTLIFSGTHAIRLTKVLTAALMGALYWETDRFALYQVQMVAAVRAWVLLRGMGLMPGTIVTPNLKPTDLGTNDTGFLFHATDYDRIYRWSGAAWADGPAQPPREQIQFFVLAPPGAGWALCNGAAATISTTVGATAAYTTPSLTAATRFLRSNTASGGTGGATSHTHAINPPNTTSNAVPDIIIVAAGVGSLAANDSHSHDVDIASFTSGSASSDPVYYDALPYVRL